MAEVISYCSIPIWLDGKSSPSFLLAAFTCFRASARDPPLKMLPVETLWVGCS
jgi:hypothetical protein